MSTNPERINRHLLRLAVAARRHAALAELFGVESIGGQRHEEASFDKARQAAMWFPEVHSLPAMFSGFPALELGWRAGVNERAQAAARTH